MRNLSDPISLFSSGTFPGQTSTTNGSAASAVPATINEKNIARAEAIGCMVKILSFLNRTDVAAGHDHIVEPNGLAVFPILFRRVALVVAVVFEPEAIYFQIHVVAPADASEFSDQLSVHPHGLFAVGFVRRGIRLNHELPALPLIQRRDDAVLPGGRAFARAGREEAVAPVFVHLPIRFH